MTSTRPGDRVPIPRALAERPWDEKRNVPIPVMNTHTDRRRVEPFVDFLGVDPQQAERLGRNRLCGACEEPLDLAEIVFIGTPHVLETGIVSDPPLHLGCARVAALRLCPYLRVQRYKRAPEHRLHPEAYIPDEGAPPKPEWWVMAVVRSYTMGLLAEGVLVFQLQDLLRWRQLTYTGVENELTEQPWEETGSGRPPG